MSRYPRLARFATIYFLTLVGSLAGLALMSFIHTGSVWGGAFGGKGLVDVVLAVAGWTIVPIMVLGFGPLFIALWLPFIVLRFPAGDVGGLFLALLLCGILYGMLVLSCSHVSSGRGPWIRGICQAYLILQSGVGIYALALVGSQ